MIVVRRLLLDVIIWFSAPLVFLFIYTSEYSFPLYAFPAHLRVAAVPFLFFVALRAVFILTAVPARVDRAVTAAVVSLAWLAMMSYYALVLTGLRFWNRVISWELIFSYSGQLSGLADVLDVSPNAIVLLACCVHAGVFALAWLYLKKFDWAAPLGARMSRSALSIATGLIATILALEIFMVATARPQGDGEPVAMTLYPLWVSDRMQTHAIDTHSSQVLDRHEDLARSSYRPNPQAHKANVILIVVDALRPANMGVYGYARDTTPYLSKLADLGALSRIDGVRSSCAESACGITSLLTSKYVHQFSARPFGLYEVLKHYGYKVHLILGGDHKMFYGLASAYGEVDSYFDAGLGKGRYFNDDQIVLDRASELPAWNGTPVALHFHLMSAHVLGAKENVVGEFLPAATYALPQNHTAHRKQHIVNYYDNGVLKTDTVVEELLAILNSKGFLKDAVVVITADHGEALGEHGSYSHAQGAWDEVLRIPLLIAAHGEIVGFKGGREIAGQIDIAPSILFALDMPRPTSWAGTPLQEPIGAKLQYFLQFPQTGLIDFRDQQSTWKVWIDRKTGQSFVFNLTRDPGETTNLDSVVAPEQRREWRARIASLPPVEEFRATLLVDSTATEHRSP